MNRTNSNKKPKTSKSSVECSICLDIPLGRVLQCKNGHLYCQDCFKSLCSKPSVHCAVCRVSCDRNNPARSLLAESLVAQMEFPCKNTPCTTFFRPTEKKEHERNCPYKLTRCLFAGFGCDWRGPAKESPLHKKSCLVAKQRLGTFKKTHKKQLGLVHTLLNAQKVTTLVKKTTPVELTTNFAAGKDLLEFLTSRTRKMLVKEIHLFKDNAEKDKDSFKSPEFYYKNNEFNFLLKVQLIKESFLSLEFGLRVRRESEAVGADFFSVAFLKAPELFFNFPGVATFNVKLENTADKTGWHKVEVPFQHAVKNVGPKQFIKELRRKGSLPFRVLLADKADGISRSFEIREDCSDNDSEEERSSTGEFETSESFLEVD